MSNSNIVVLVTGGSGFIGSHVVHRLLQKGYTVRTTVRSLSKSEQVIKQVIPNTNPALKDRLSFFEVDLLSDKGWKEATSGIDYLLHVASPFPSSSPKDENVLIKPAVEGTLRALRFAKENEKTKRVIITSSVAAIAYGHDDYTQTLDERNWSDPSKPIGAYIKSKTLAEKSAWEYANENGIPMATVNPVLVIGPLLPGTKDIGTSIDIIKKIANGGIPAAPVISVGVVDVRDVAEMHLRAMERDDAKGKRFLATTGQGEFTTIQELGKVLGKNVWILPDFVVKFGAWFSTSLAELAQGLGHTKKTSNKQAREVLGIDFIPLEQSVKDTVESLKQEGML